MNIFKRTIAICTLGIMILSVPVMAATENFGFTLVLNQHTTGATATKAGGSKFEKKYYLRQTTISYPQNATRRFYYYPVFNNKKTANALNLSASDTKSHNNTYLSGEAKAGRKYKLYCKCTGSKRESAKSTVSGRWTP